MLELYHSGLTTCSKQVRLCLAEKALDYVSHYIELWRYENLRPEYLALNPNGVVPTLVYDGRAITNSLVINEYLDDVFPEVAMRPADAGARARMRLWCWTADDVHPAVTNATYSAFMKSHAEELAPDDIERMLAATPVPERRERWRRITEGVFTEKELDDSFARLDFTVGRVDAALADGPFLAGAEYSLADISMLAIIHRINELRPDFLTRRPRAADWRERMMARPHVARVYAPGTAETPPRPKGVSLAGLD